VVAEIATAAALRRRELAAQWWTAAEVSTMLRSRAADSSELPKALRKEGRVLGVWVPSEHAYRYPPWQFRDANVISEMQILLGILRNSAALVSLKRGISAWSDAAWFLAPNALLGGKTPAETLSMDAKRVVRIARKEFEDGVDADGF
jgi:hypothetical protein